MSSTSLCKETILTGCNVAVNRSFVWDGYIRPEAIWKELMYLYQFKMTCES